MGFLIRCAFWLALALLFIPFGTSGRTSAVDTVSPVQAFAAARNTVGDLASFCERQPGVCATASAAIHTITARAREGMRIAEELVNSEQATQAEGAEEGPVGQDSSTGSIAPSEQIRTPE